MRSSLFSNVSAVKWLVGLSDGTHSNRIMSHLSALQDLNSLRSLRSRLIEKTRTHDMGISKSEQQSDSSLFAPTVAIPVVGGLRH